MTEVDDFRDFELFLCDERVLHCFAVDEQAESVGETEAHKTKTIPHIYLRDCVGDGEGEHS